MDQKSEQADDPIANAIEIAKRELPGVVAAAIAHKKESKRGKLSKSNLIETGWMILITAIAVVGLEMSQLSAEALASGLPLVIIYR